MSENNYDEISEHWQVVNSGQVVVSNTAQELWEAACSYFAWCDSSNLKVNFTVMSGKRAGDDIKGKRKRPYTVRALCLHCGVSTEYLNDMLSLDRNEEYYMVASRIMYIIHTQNLESAMVGEFNPVMVSKLLNMDKPDETQKPIRIDIVGDMPALSNSENEVLEKLKSEKPDFKTDEE